MKTNVKERKTEMKKDKIRGGMKKRNIYNPKINMKKVRNKNRSKHCILK